MLSPEVQNLQAPAGFATWSEWQVRAVNLPLKRSRRESPRDERR